MKLKRTALFLTLILIMTPVITLAGNSEYYPPMWNESVNVDTSVQKSGSRISAEATVITADSNTNVTGTLYLQKRMRGYWRSVSSWSFEGAGLISVSKYYSGGSGTYRTKVVVRSGGETITEYSSETYIE